VQGQQGNVVVITGAQGQAGSAIARRLAGTSPLALLDHAQGTTQEPSAGAPSVVFGGVDVTDESSVQQVVARVRTELGPIRALVHTVGAYADGVDVIDQSASAVRRMLELNYLAAVHLVHTVLPDLVDRDGSRIVLFASTDALHGRAGASAYAAAKAALLRFAESLAAEVAPRGVLVRVLVPTTIDTPANRASRPDADFASWVTLDEVASTVEFLLSPASSGIRFAAVPLGA
jgi:NAD(P)-dependent dehydrogenase (short-subunit alcohol dehydrogenase family)